MMLEKLLASKEPSRENIMSRGSIASNDEGGRNLEKRL
jgi:hypothetical protein